MSAIPLAIPASAAASLLSLSAAIWMFCAGTAAFLARGGAVSDFIAAAALTPSDASLWRQAGLKLLEPDPKRARTYLRRAVQLNPRDADALLGLAFLDEQSGRLTTAEQSYQAATRVSRRFQPSYALASFYVRQNRAPLFWAPASTAAAVPSADLQKLFHLALQAGQDPRALPRLLNLRSQHALVSYFTFLLQEGHLDQLAELGDAIEPHDQTDLLLNACDRLLDAGRTADAAKTWNRLGTQGNPAFTPLDPNGGRALANGAFLPGPPRGFNWRSYEMPDVTVGSVNPSGLRIEFSGKQPESGAILNQPLWLLPRHMYRLHFRFDPSGLSSSEGLQWGLLAGKTLAALAPWPVGSSQGVFDFQVPAEPATLFLRYVRAPGTVRARGSLTLLSAELTCLP